jgi:hypothetical protein
MLFRSLLVLLALVALPLEAAGQSSFINTDPYTVSVNPQYPPPYGQVILTPVSGSLNLANATMTVTADAKQLYSGNAQPVTVPLGAAGALTTITITVSSNGQTYPKTLSIRPQDVVLIAEPIASAPSIYPGKPRVPLEGSVRVVAVANLRNAAGVAQNPAQLSYSWVVDDTRIASASGVGKDTIMVASPLQYRSRSVSITVQSQDGSLVGGASLSLAPEEPTVRIYESDPLLGVLFERAIGSTHSIAGSEKTFLGIGFSLPTRGGAPLLRWFLNGAAAQTGSTITLRPTGSGSGSASLSLVASAGEFTTATKNVSINFGAARSGLLNLFGL